STVFATTCNDCVNLCCRTGLTCTTLSEVNACRTTCTENGFCKTVTVSAFHGTAFIGGDGRRVYLTGPLTCPEGAQVRPLPASLTQRFGGAVAEGSLVELECTGQDQEFQIEAHARTPTAFQPGPARACALLTLSDNGQISDVVQWCVDIQLEEE